MPYTEATLMEVHRIASIVPLSLFHKTSKDTTLGGYFIPKGSSIMPHLWNVHYDPEYFPEPEVFKPERFLTDDRKVKRCDQLIPFSIGKRQCIGESLARMELFLYFTSMLQRFSFESVEGEDLDFDCEFTIVLEPKTKLLRAIPR